MRVFVFCLRMKIARLTDELYWAAQLGWTLGLRANNKSHKEKCKQHTMLSFKISCRQSTFLSKRPLVTQVLKSNWNLCVGTHAVQRKWAFCNGTESKRRWKTNTYFLIYYQTSCLELLWKYTQWSINCVWPIYYLEVKYLQIHLFPLISCYTFSPSFCHLLLITRTIHSPNWNDK